DDIWPLRQLTPTVMTSALHLFKPAEAYRRVVPATIDYYLDKPADKVTVEILDAQGKVLRTIDGSPEATKKAEAQTGFRRPPMPPPTAAGLNRYDWNLQLAGPTTFEGMILWGANPQEGPYVVPGNYQVRVTANGQTQTQPLVVKLDPRIHGVTQSDLEEEFTLSSQIQAQVSRANEGVIQIRKMRGEIADRLKTAKNARVTAAGEELTKKLSAVEEDLYQVKNRSGQDPLNFAIKINNRLAALEGIVEGADSKPTAQSYTIFNDEKAELDKYMGTLDSIVQTDLTAFNKLLAGRKLPPVSGR
ncbi:MAG TPA: FlgD immunoglobulin-like domain containing protein, partial [Vicinamibacterales bacterium]|nr:FlgD immunoglobulin-like domain containing protein [Vicinamibacterales bacterium]